MYHDFKINFFPSGTSCKTWIELPQLRDMTDLIAMTKFITKRCFDKILIYIDMDRRLKFPENEVFDLMLHQIELFKHVYGHQLASNIGVYVQNSTKLSDDVLLELKKDFGEKTPVSYVKYT